MGICDPTRMKGGFTCKADFVVVLEGPHLVLAHLAAFDPGAIGVLVPEEDSRAVLDDLALAL